MNLKNISLIFGLAGLVIFGVGASASGQFYQDKTLRIIVSSSPGGGNDTYTRLMARHLVRHIPGKPKIIVENMPGGGGLVAANYLYEQAERDGTVMEQINWGVWHYQGIKDSRARFDFGKMHAVGAIVVENAVFYSRPDRYKSIEAIHKSGKLATVGVSGRQSTGFILGRLIEKVTGYKLFDMVMAYPGARQYSLALRQGEVDTSSNTKSSFFDQLGDMYKEGKLVLLAQAGTLKGERDKDFPKVPTLMELATSEKGKEIAEATLFFQHYGRPYFLPQEVPEDRVKTLRDAFDKTMADEKFLAEARKLRRPVDPLSGKELQQVVNKDINPSPEMFEIVSEVFGQGNK